MDEIHLHTAHVLLSLLSPVRAYPYLSIAEHRHVISLAIYHPFAATAYHLRRSGGGRLLQAMAVF